MYELNKNTKYEKSCGAIIYRKNNDEIEYLLIQMIEGQWGFPKGHVENNETEIETALREVKEEVGCIFSLDDIDKVFKAKSHYNPRINVEKDVIFFLINDNLHQQVIIQETELKDYCWCGYNIAYDLITFQVNKEILFKADKYINEKNKKKDG